jgi:hypothetical protein
MNFKLLSKNNVGSAFLLLVIILLSQARTFDYFVNNYLGRVLLITAVIVLSYINKILGVVLVLFVIMMMNKIDFLHLEGMENASDANTSANASSSGNNADLTPEEKKKLEEKVEEVITENKETPTQSVEGFNVTETEDDMKKGKDSNTIPVDENVKNGDMVEAFDSFEFKDNYASI